MKSKINSYGKTWHFWETGVFRRPRTDLPTGPARLAWSTNRDGEVLPGLLAKRDEEMGVDTARRRAARAELARLARPQEGVDALKDAFPGAGGRPEGVAPKPAH